MAEKTGISWTDKTWNPIQGCRKVSPGCLNCYMFRDKKRYGQDPLDVHISKPATFNRPLHWKEPAKVFTCSWSDWFIEEFDERRPEAWEIIRKTPHLTYQILTKRPERIERCLPPYWRELKNVWLGVSVESNDHIDRIRLAANRNPAVLFASVEPLLGPVDLFKLRGHHRPDWVICGGESGPGFREMSITWAENLKAQCESLEIPFFFKQVSGATKKQCSNIPNSLKIMEFPAFKRTK